MTIYEQAERRLLEAAKETDLAQLLVEANHTGLKMGLKEISLSDFGLEATRMGAKISEFTLARQALLELEATQSGQSS